MMKISIIVPVYNVEQYLQRCINSILAQTYKKIEIIIVDDGSPDNCPVLCENIAKTDSRIIVVHQKNAGLAGARNTGVNTATGDFIGFVDSDDWIEPDTYEHCTKLIKEHKADLIQYQLGYAYDDSIKFKNENENLEIINGKDILQHYLYSTTTGKGGDYSVCMCLFKKELLNGVRFRTGKINEDIDFKYKAFSNAKLMVNTNLKKYYYFQQNESISMGGLSKKDFDLYEAAEELVKLSEGENYGNIREMVMVKKARTPLSLLCKIAYFGVADLTFDKKELVKKLTKEHRTNVKLLLGSQIPISRKILATLFAINYKLAETCIKIAK